MNNNKILIISTTPTHPPFSGNRSAILSYAELLKEMDYNVSFLFVQTYETTTNDKIKTQKYWEENFFYYKTNKFYYRKRKFYSKIYKENFRVDNWYPNGLECFVKKIQKQRNFKIVIVNYIWLTKLFKYLPNLRKILFTHDVFSNRFKKTNIRWFTVSPREEARALNRCDVVLAIQENEGNYLKSLSKVKVVTTFSPVKYVNIDFCNNRNLLFLSGPNDYNTNGLIKFVKDIWFELKKDIQGIKLLIGGGICRRKEIYEFENDIQLLGEIDNLFDFYSKGDVFINPVFEGTGLKIKNMEALSYGKIVLCHPHNTEGIYDEENAPIFKVSNTKDYLIILNNLFNSPDTILYRKELIIEYIERYNEIVRERYAEALGVLNK